MQRAGPRRQKIGVGSIRSGLRLFELINHRFRVLGVFLQKGAKNEYKPEVSGVYGGVFGQRHVAGGYVAAKVGSGAPIAPKCKCHGFDQNVSVRGKCFGRFVSVLGTSRRGRSKRLVSVCVPPCQWALAGGSRDGS